MASISTDQEFKKALDQLSSAQQRVAGALFVERVLELCDDARVRRAVDVAKNINAQEGELDGANREAKSAAVESYTACGRDTDWSAQAAHFVATAAAECSVPPSRSDLAHNAAWDAAMYVRMARTSENIAKAHTDHHDEAEAQYQLLTQFLAGAA